MSEQSPSPGKYGHTPIERLARWLYEFQSQPSGPAEALPSPCIGVCRSVEQKVFPELGRMCAGCLRTVAEVAAWGEATDDFRLEVWAQLAQRLQALQASKR